jgi:hypothetical protein
MQIYHNRDITELKNDVQDYNELKRILRPIGNFTMLNFRV